MAKPSVRQAVAALALLLAAPGLAVELTYLANEGVLLRQGEITVVIDGLFRNGIDPYARHAAGELDKLERAEPPYDRVRLALVSHLHGDHFDAASVARFLTSAPMARLVSSQQVADAVAALHKERVEGVLPEDGRKVTRSFGGVSVTLFRLSHGGGRHASVQNLGHIVRIGGVSFLHIGDAEPGAARFDLYELPKEKIDVAMVPFWYLTDPRGRTVVNTLIRPRQLVAFHLPPSEYDRWAPQILANYPKAVILRTPGSSHSFPTMAK
ncbi:MAG: MBL fold metallo-hydrolase [Bryobacteraceae bacterium]|nr:MBL fold metallo-hydrolase [Bryobacteraceae bacterium]